MRHRAKSLLLILLACQLALGLPVMRPASAVAPAAPAAAMHCPEHAAAARHDMPAAHIAHPHNGAHECCKGADRVCQCSAVAPGLMAQAAVVTAPVPASDLLPVPNPPVMQKRTDELLRPPIA